LGLLFLVANHTSIFSLNNMTHVITFGHIVAPRSE
jgi:hypothetical protein